MPRGKANESNKAKKSSNKQSNTKGINQSKKKSDAAAGKSSRENIQKGKESQSRKGRKRNSNPENTGVSLSVAAAAKNKRIAKWEQSENLILLEGWARDGLSMEQIAHNMGISKDTLYRWLKLSSYISDAIKKGKEVTDYLVENALFTSALTGNVVAQIFWLKNRKPEKWKDKVEQVIDTEADTAGIVLLAPVLEKNHEPTEESDMGATTETD